MKNIAFLITVYKKDRLDFFTEAIESIVNQDYGFENINIYLGIDGILDESVNSYIKENESYFHKIIINKENKGLAYTLNRLISSLEEEEYIFRMDSDDICREDRVSKQLKEFFNDNELMLLGSNLIEINELGEEIRKKIMPIKREDIIKFSIARNPFNHPTVALRREFFEQVGLYNEQYRKSQDYELWARALIKEVKIANIDEFLLYFRISYDYLSKRNSIINYLNEFKVSLLLMTHFKFFTHFPKILIKLIVRLLPNKIGNYIYKKIRT